MIGIIGKKVGMTQIFNADGQQIPCTVVEAPPNTRHRVTSVAPFQLAYAVSVPFLSVTASAGLVWGAPFQRNRYAR